MAVPIYQPLDSTQTTITVTITPMSSLVQTGGYVIDSYHVEFFDGSFWSSVQGEDGSFTLDTTAAVIDLTGGDTYKFRVQAHNIHGWGLTSDELVVVASGVPSKPDPIIVTIENLDVKIDWTPPSENFATITAYQVRIVESDGSTFTEQILHCDGTSAYIVSTDFCLIPETVLRAAPYSLLFDTLIEADVRALN